MSNNFWAWLGSIYIGLLVIGILIALIPAFIAYSRGHAYRHIILVLCLFAWTGVVWVIAFVWAIWPTEKSLLDPIAGNVTGTGRRNVGDTYGSIKVGIQRGAWAEPGFRNEPDLIQSSNTSLDSSERVCPHCAETIKAAARVCRYCKLKVEPSVGFTSY